MHLYKSDMVILEEVRKYLLRNLSQHITIPDLLRRYPTLNEEKLRKGFKKLYGDSIRSFITEARMQHAEHLLTSTELPVKDIARRVGYHSNANFTHAFRRYFGHPPTDYRK